ncbi:MAG: hemolysin III family protein [Anaerolineales bacterium]|nr:hemolysin III family protein [Anaerolineales bacterium]MCB0018859.1 hemolysin III family protein [Anaerolineales bacterium]MCB0026383.1 hemolysin III family protein [Anaerolineales bacterium]
MFRSRSSSVRQTIPEEIANSISHGIGAGLAVAGLTILVMVAADIGDPWRITSGAIYGASMIILFLASTLYHSFQKPEVKRVLRIVDHASIYLLIAGTYTPFLLVSLRGALGWTFFAIVWGLTLVGIIFKLFFTHRFDVLSTLVYLGMGWMVMFAWGQLRAAVPEIGVTFLWIGGLSYTVGVIFYALQRVKFSHTIWHLFVLGGSICHFFAVLWGVMLPATHMAS